VICGALAGALAVVAFGGCKPRPTADECAQMLDRYVDMTAAEDPSLVGLDGNEAAELRAAKRASKRLEPTYARSLAQCQSEVSRSEYDCAMAAKTPNDWEACIE